MEFELINNQKLFVRLITIIKRGDYIVQIINNKYEKAEVFINRAHVISIIYKPDSEDLVG